MKKMWTLLLQNDKQAWEIIHPREELKKIEDSYNKLTSKHDLPSGTSTPGEESKDGRFLDFYN